MNKDVKIVAGLAGAGKSRYLMKRASDELVSSENQGVFYFCDEHTGSYILTQIEEGVAGRSVNNTISISATLNTHEIPKALELLEEHIKEGKAVKVFLDIHSLGVRRGIANQLYALNEKYPTAKIGIEVMTQVHASLVPPPEGYLITDGVLIKNNGQAMFE